VPTPTLQRALIVVLGSVCGILFTSPRSTLHAQALDLVSGIVLNVGNSEPLKGVTVTVLEGDFRAVTDEDGRFLFSDLPAAEVTLKIELSGYASVVERVILTPVEVGVLQVRLAPIFATLEELKVMVDDPAPRSSSDIEIVRRSDDFRTAFDLLADEIPGVNAGLQLNSGGARIRIRGSSSLTLSNAPAIYLDGIRVNAQGAGTAVSSGLHALELIPASQVESIQVLKGPSTTGQYGDASQGVVLIQTRKGKR
jgi:hypothetical protein